MAVMTPPPYAQSGSYSALADRTVLSSTWSADAPGTRIGPYPGVVPRATSIDFAHSLAGSQLTVGPGAAVVAGTENVFQLAYLAYNDANMVFTIADAPAGQTRRDLIVLRVRDQFYSGAVTDADMVVVQGTPAASNPQDPVLPANSYAIKRAEKTATGTPTITNLWEYQAAPGAITPSRTSTPPGRAPRFGGQYRDDGAGNLQRGSAEGGTWDTIATVAAPSQFAPTLVAGGSNTLVLGTGGTAVCYYRKVGRWLDLAYQFLWGTSPWSAHAGAITTQLPPGVSGATLEQLVPAKIWIPPGQGPGDGIYQGLMVVDSGSALPKLYFPLTSDDHRLEPYRLSTAGAAGTGVPLVTAYPQGGNLTASGRILTAA